MNSGANLGRMATVVKRTRTYNTTLRKQQAEMTRQRILEAARRMLVSGGYSRVTMEEIARQAGVAYQTVYSIFGTKLRLAQDMIEADWPHIQEALSLFEDARTSPDPEVWLRTLTAVSRRIYEPCVDLTRFMRESGDPDLLGHYRDIERGRYERLRGLGPVLQRSGRLRPTLSPAEAVAIVWAMTGPDYYIQHVFERGWSPERFEAWLGEALTDLILVRP
jgi:AcrR family transcriptional regulator